MEKKELALGIKTFFVAPDLSLFPEEFLKTFFLKGYETYFLEDDAYCPLEAKVDALFGLFSQVILFFNIDRRINGVDWPLFIRGIQNRYGERAIIGVMFQKRNDQEDVRTLERLYLYSIGIFGGCIPIEYKKVRNLTLFLNVLAANQANGQRRRLRAVCDDSYKANMAYGGIGYRCLVRDISISHFSCVFPDDKPEIPLHERINQIQMSLHGIILKVDGVLCLKRVLNEDEIYVFVFRTREGREGLNPDNLERVNDLVFRVLSGGIQEMLRAEFSAIRARRLAGQASASSLAHAPIAAPTPEGVEVTPSD